MKTSREDRTPVQALSALHESATVRAVTGPAVRPGGFSLTERGLSACGFRSGARILDVGCGAGASVDFLRRDHGFMAAGVDMSGNLFPGAGGADRLPLAIARAEALPFSDGCCDGVLCECVLSLVEEPERALREFSRVLRAGGCMILSDVYDRLSGSGHGEAGADTDGRKGQLRPMACVERLLEEAGFEMLLREDHTRHLKELAAQLILCGESGAGVRELCTYFASGFSCAPASRTVLPGYFLLVARKPTKGEFVDG